ncbi:hypothetical protein LTS18_005599 [Coniosporium uncinatum]|uniref:Uncharacterized protein n=1 Tax=Coniosporium uncinatum TaxID=93489 RepID=A0ACC3D4G6_9PEZI|nr:hypothetical protein LTS18_005599 [Coniosporium uncinatum]
MELIAVTALISQYMDTRNLELLLGDIREMRSVIRQNVIDLRANTDTWRKLWTFISHLEEHRGAVDGSTMARPVSKEITQRETKTDSSVEEERAELLERFRAGSNKPSNNVRPSQPRSDPLPNTLKRKRTSEPSRSSKQQRASDKNVPSLSRKPSVAVWLESREDALAPNRGNDEESTGSQDSVLGPPSDAGPIAQRPASPAEPVWQSDGEDAEPQTSTVLTNGPTELFRDSVHSRVTAVASMGYNGTRSTPSIPSATASVTSRENSEATVTDLDSVNISRRTPRVGSAAPNGVTPRASSEPRASSVVEDAKPALKQSNFAFGKVSTGARALMTRRRNRNDTPR